MEIEELKYVHSEIDLSILNLLENYKESESPIEVSFRDLIPELKNKDRFTHLIHSYPAKLLMHIPFFFLNNSIFSKKGDVVLDPFCGTGTVLLEAILAGRNAIGADANPLARLIAKVKVDKLNIPSLRDTLGNIVNSNDKINYASSFPDVVNIDYWFNVKIKKSLLILRDRINEIENLDEKDFFKVCFSNLIKKVSYADPRISVPVKLNPKRYVEGSNNYIQACKRIQDLESVDVFSKFETICKENINRAEQVNRLSLDSNVKATIVSKDARNLTKSLEETAKLESESVDLIITSPPYAGAQKYIRSSSLNLGWLDLAKSSELRKYDGLNIGRENFSKLDNAIRSTNIEDCDKLIRLIESINSKRAQIVSTYMIEMQQAISESIRVLKTGGYFVLIVGNNKVCNFEFNTQQYLATYMQQNGLKLVLRLIDDIKSYGLMTKRNKTADIISREWVLIFEKL